jgi:hypothetical protein
MLSLSDQQLQQLTCAASMVPPGDRDLFLRSVAAQLVRRPISDQDVAASICFVLEGRNVSTSRSLFLSNQPRPRRFRSRVAPRRFDHARS